MSAISKAEANRMLLDASHDDSFSTGGFQRENIQKALMSGAEINTQDGVGKTALIHAAGFSSGAICQQLLDAGANLELPNHDGYTPLIYAGLMGNADACKTLIAAHADIEAKCDDGNTPLMWAVLSNKEEACRVLIAAGANMYAESKDGQSLLAWACAQDRYFGVRELLRGGVESIHHPLVKKATDSMQDYIRHEFKEGTLPNAGQCLTPEGNIKPEVLDACVCGQFDPLIGGPLLSQGSLSDLQLFKDIWDQLPERWQNENQGLYMGYVKQVQELQSAIIYPDRRQR